MLLAVDVPRGFQGFLFKGLGVRELGCSRFPQSAVQSSCSPMSVLFKAPVTQKSIKDGYWGDSRRLPLRPIWGIFSETLYLRDERSQDYCLNPKPYAWRAFALSGLSPMARRLL